MRQSRKAVGATPSSIRIATIFCAGCRRRPISRCRSWPANWRRWACGSRRLRCRAGTCATAIAIKKTLLASEQDRPDVHAARTEWITKRQPRMRREPDRLVFVDETGTNTKMTRPRGRCLKGHRLRAKAPFGHWKIQTFIAGLRREQLRTAPFVVDQPMNRRIFDTLGPDPTGAHPVKIDVVVLDNLPAQQSQAAEQAISARSLAPVSAPSPAPISTQSRWHSPSSRLICANGWPGPSSIYGGPSGHLLSLRSKRMLKLL